MPETYQIATTRIVVTNHQLEAGYRDGFERFAHDYPDSFPTDTDIATFIGQHASNHAGGMRTQAGVILGWCAALLTRCLFVALPTQQRGGERR